MSQVIELARYRRSRRRLYFNRAELSQLMGLYSRRVSSGEWRDYAIDHLEGMAVFSVFRNTHDQPLFSIVKLAGRPGRDPEFMAAAGGHKFAGSKQLSEVLDKAESRFQQRLSVVK